MPKDLTTDATGALPPLDPSSAEWIADHYAILARYRELDPVHAVATGPENDPWASINWELTRYDDVVQVLKDRRFVREWSTLHPEAAAQPDARWADLQESQFNWMLLRDPPGHTRLRSLVSRAFTPRMVNDLRGRIEEIAQGLIQSLTQGSGSSRVDVVPEYAFALPVMVIAELLGVPPGDREKFRAWSRPIAKTVDVASEDDLIAANQATIELREYLRTVVEWRRRDPKDDLISGLARASQDEGRLSELELIDTCILLLVAGHETTVNLIANGIWLLGTHDATLKMLQREPGRFPDAVEEILRYEGSVQVTGRIAGEDVTIGTRTIRRGDWVTTWLAAANRDPARFTDPNVFDINRKPNGNVTFGGGAHFCLGAPLARLEGDIALSAFVRAYPNFRLEQEVPLWRRGVTFRSLERLEVLLDG